MNDIFDLNKLYIFSKDKYYTLTGRKDNWAKMCDKKIVDVENNFMGNIVINGEEYIILPQYCLPLKVKVKSSEKGNLYNDNEGVVIDDNGLKWKKVFKPSKQNNEEISYKLSDIIQKIESESIFKTDMDNPLFNAIMDGKLNDKFDEEYGYIFDIELVDKDEREEWMKHLNHERIDSMPNENEAFIYCCYDDTYHRIEPSWCVKMMFEEGKYYKFCFDYIELFDRLGIGYELSHHHGHLITEILDDNTGLIEGCNIKIKRKWCEEISEDDFEKRLENN